MTTTNEAPVLNVENLSVEYAIDGQAFTAVDGVSFHVGRGERVAIVGESGSGKTSLISAVLGLLPSNGQVTSGRIEFADVDLTAINRHAREDLLGRHIGLVPQDPMSNLNPMFTIGNQIMEVVTRHLGVGRAEAKRRAVAALTAVGFPNAQSRLGQYPHELSGGLRQRVLIAIALVCEPEFIIADEPTSALDVTVQKQILDHLEDLIATSGTSMLFVTHDLGLAAERSEYVIVMYHGSIVETGPSEQVLRSPKDPYTQRLVAADPAVAIAHTEHGIGGNIHTGDESHISVKSEQTSEPILELRNAVREYQVKDEVTGKRQVFRALGGVSMDLRAVETLGVVGESGSGKSTAARLMLCLDRPDSGTLFFRGKPVSQKDKSELKVFRHSVQPVFQDPYSSLDPVASIGSILEEPLVIQGGFSRADRRKKALEMIDLVSLSKDTYGRYPYELSGGQRQRIAIARALILRPEVIVCDEAVSALDVLVQAQILDLLQSLQREFSLSYVFISHDLAVIRLIADRVVVMRAGEVVERGSVAQVFDTPHSEYTRALLDAIPGRELFATV